MPVYVTGRRQLRGKRKYATTNRKGKMRIIRVPRNIALREHQFVRTVNSVQTLWGNWPFYSGIAAMANGYAAKDFTFSFDQIPAYTEFTNMFERYRIDKIIVEIACPNTVTSGLTDLGAAQQDVAQMFLVSLPSDDTQRVNVSKNLSAVQEMSKPKHRALVNPYSKPIRIECKPNILIQTYETGALTGYTPRYSPWLFTEEYTHIHYGLSLGLYRADGGSLDPAVGPNLPSLNMKTTYVFSCKTTN